MGGYGHRNMYYLTGLPGWMRSGYFGQGYPGFPTPFDPWGVVQISPEEELNFLKGQSEVLEDELDGVNQRIKGLEKELKEKKGAK